MPSPSRDIQRHMANLRTLADLLGAETDRLPRTSNSAHRLCRESLMTISVLVPKLEATFKALLEHELDEPSTGIRCEACDD